MNSLFRLFTVGAALCGLSARAIIIDDFSANQALVTGPGASTLDHASVLGGERDVQVTLTSGAGPISAEVKLGYSDHILSSSSTGSSVITWDGNDNDASTLAFGLGPVNLTTGGDNAFLLGINSLTGTPTIKLEVFTTAANWSTFTLVNPTIIPTHVRIPYSAFSVGGGSGANFASAAAIRLTISGTAAANVRLDFLRTGSSAAPATEVTLTDVVLVDNDGNGRASAGDTLRYQLRLANNTGSTLSNVVLNVPAIANAGAPANIAALPNARDEGPIAASVPGNAFHTPFNTTLTVNDGDADEDLLNNDFVGAPAATITRFGGGTLGGTVDSNNSGSPVNVGGHTLQVNANGSFVYTPAAGFAGLFNFQYRLANAQGSDTATVTIAVGERPSAVADARSVTGNVQIDTATGTAFSVLSNDDGDAVTINLNTAGTLGAVNMSANGQFVYTPPRGKSSGTDTFSYTLQNGFGTSSPATVTLNFDGNIVWFIDVAAGAGDGRSHSPYNSLAAFNTVNDGAPNNPADNHVIVLRDGTYNNNVAGGALVLRNGQRVVGDGWSGTFLAASGFSLGAHSVVAPFSGADPVIQNSTGHGVALLSGNQLRGLTVGNTPNGFGYSGTAVGSPVIAECSKTGTGGAMSITISGTFGSSVSFDTLESTSSTGANLNLVGVTGTLNVTSAGSGFTGSVASSAAINISGGSVSLTYTGAVAKANLGALLNVAGGHTGTLIFNTGTLNASAGTGLQFDDADGTYNFNGTTTLNSGDAGVDILNGCAGSFTFGTGTVITSPTGIAFNVDGGATTSTCNVTYSGNITQANNAAMVNVRNHNTGTITFQTGTLSASNGTGLQFDNCDSTTSYNFNGTTTLNGGDAGIDIINGSAGNFTFANANITNPSGAAFLVSGGGGTISHTGTISKNNAGRLVDIQSRTGGSVTLAGNLSSTGTSTGILCNGNTGGSITFSGATKTLNTGTSTAVSLTSNNGATINFSNGGLGITTTSGTGFNATGGATAVNVAGSGNTIASTTGTALNIVNTTIGSSGVTFRSISANGATTGVVLNNTGASGSLTVSGDGNTAVGGNSSGGTIQNNSTAISLTSTLNPSFNNMNIQNSVSHGVSGTLVNGFTFNHGTINNSGTGLGPETANIAFNTTAAGTENNLSGTVNIVGNLLTTAYYHGIDIFNFNGTIADANIANNTITSTTSTATSKGSGIRFIGFGSATTVANITRATVSQNRVNNFPSATGIQVQGGNANSPGATPGTYGTSAANPIAIISNLISGQSAANRFGAFGLAIVVNGRGTGNFDISGNSVSNSIGTAISIGSFGSATLTAVVNNNTVVANNSVGAQGIGAGTSQTFGSSDTPTLHVTINNNNISQTDGNGILVTARDANGHVNAAIKNNTVAAPLTGNRNGIRVDAGNSIPGSDDDVCLDISGNTSAGSGLSPEGIGLRKEGTSTTVHAFGIEGMAATSSPGIESYVGGLNPGSAINGGTGLRVLLISASSGFSNCSSAP